MHISIPKHYLIKPLQTVCSIVDRKTTAAILSNACIKYEQGYLYFLATDMELQICHKIAIENLKDFSFTVAAKKTLDIIKVLADDNIEWRIKENKLQISQNKSNFEVHTLPSEDFPLMQTQEAKYIEFNISQKQLKHQLYNVAFAMALQDVRYYLNGMLFKLENNKLIVVATDGHRMACSKSNNYIEQTDNIEAILPRKTILELLRLLTDNDENINIKMYAGQIIFNLGDIEIISKLIDGKFPDYNRIIPSNHPYLLNLKKSDLHLGLQRVSILTNDKLRAARFILHQNGLSLFASNNDNEEVKEDIAVNYNGDNFEVGFNIIYWLEVLNVIKQEQLNISLNNSNTSALLNAEDEIHTYQYIIMPMRI